MRHSGPQWSPDIWYKDVLQKTSLQLLQRRVTKDGNRRSRTKLSTQYCSITRHDRLKSHKTVQGTRIPLACKALLLLLLHIFLLPHIVPLHLYPNNFLPSPPPHVSQLCPSKDSSTP